MARMKDSGLEWIGQIPEDWDLVPVYKHFGERKHLNVFGQEKNLLSLSYGNIIRKDINTVGGLLPANFNTYNIVEKDDIIIRPTDLQNDKHSLRTGLVTEKGIITSAYIALMPISELVSKFAYYQLHSYDIKKVFYNMGNGVRQGLNFSEFSKLMLVVPPKEMQERIVSFLNAACSKIDSVSADIQEQIRALEDYRKSVISEAVTKGLDKNVPMKHTGIFYAPNINENWFITRLGYICTKMSRSFDEDATALICSNKGKVMIRPETMVGIMVSEDHAMQGIRQGDIAIHGMDTWHGAIALSEYDGKITRVVHVCQTDEDARFIVYYLQHLAYIGVYKLISYGVRENTSDFRSWEKTKDIYVPLPKKIEEQRVICDYLDSQIKRIDAMIATKREQLDVLAKYKQSIIYEYVTGKKQIP